MNLHHAMWQIGAALESGEAPLRAARYGDLAQVFSTHGSVIEACSSAPEDPMPRRAGLRQLVLWPSARWGSPARAPSRRPPPISGSRRRRPGSPHTRKRLFLMARVVPGRAATLLIGLRFRKVSCPHSTPRRFAHIRTAPTRSAERSAGSTRHVSASPQASRHEELVARAFAR